MRGVSGGGCRVSMEMIRESSKGGNAKTRTKRVAFGVRMAIVFCCICIAGR